jgi:hypothetical protein
MVQIIFYGSEKSETTDHQLRCFCNTHQEIYIGIDMHLNAEHFICLDKATAIKLSKELRKQIALIEDEKNI